MPPLLSVIIPTKNRQYTCIYSIEGALKIGKSDIEVIVQDCSADNLLKGMIEEKFGEDPRIKYEFVTTNPSMTDNWNAAYASATGKYMIGIGDDDGILPEVYDVAVWAEANNLEVIGHTEPYTYLWEDYPIQHYQGTIIYKKFSGEATINNNVYDTVLKRSRCADMGYAIDLPMVYHRLISRTLYNKVKEVTGKFLDATSLDVYTSFTLGLIVDKFVILDYPFSFRGACGNSNSGRIIKKKDNEHFDEFANVDYPDWIPKIKVVHVSIAESMYRAFKNTGNEELISNIDLPTFYAACLVDSPQKADLILKLCKKYLKNNSEWSKFWGQVLSKFYSLKMKTWPSKLVKKMEFIFPVNSWYRNRLLKGGKIAEVKNTVDAIDFHQDFIKNNHISLKLPSYQTAAL